MTRTVGDMEYAGGFMPKNTGGREFVRYSRDWMFGELESLIEKTHFDVMYTSDEQHGTMKKWSIVLKR